MGTKTGISWTDATWNPILGCSRVSEGCRNCYAEGIAYRFGHGKPTVYSGLTVLANGHPQWTGKIVETRQLLAPLSWRKPKRVFVNSMSDLFHENVTDEQRDRIFAVMALCPQHIFQVLTKRPKRMLEYFSAAGMSKIREALIGRQASIIHLERTKMPVLEWPGLPLPNVWLGTSVENQATADERIPFLLETPAAVKFLSAEPLLGPIDFRKVSGFNRIGLDLSNWWVICGGESGPGARPMHPDWARSLRDQCANGQVPFFFKQWGEWEPQKQASGKTGMGSEIYYWADDRTKPSDVDCHCSFKVGKKKAGSLLDGIEHKAFPEV